MRWGWWSVRQSRPLFQSLLAQTYLVVSGGVVVIGNAMFTLSSSYLMLAIGRWFPAFRMVHFLASARSCYRNYQTRQSHRRRGGDGFRDDSANLLGIPLGTYLSQEFSWRSPFY